MRLKDLAVGCAAGFAGAVITQKVLRKKTLSSEEALKIVKKQVRQALHIDGAWIYLTPQDYSKNGLNYQVYKGGLTSKDEQSSLHYDFVVDASTGTIIDLNEQ